MATLLPLLLLLLSVSWVKCFGLKPAVRMKRAGLGAIRRPGRPGRPSRFAPPITSRSCDGVLRMRGGGDNVDDESSEYDDGSDFDDEFESEEAVVPEVVDGPWADAAESAAKSISSAESAAGAASDSSIEMEQQRRSYFLCAVLWSALALDIVLNKSKRAALFAATSFASPGGAISISNAVPTASLAGGFALAAGIAWVLSQMTEVEKERGGVGRGEANEESFVRRTRRRLAVGLTMFGAINLGAHSAKGEFLGMSAAAINGHNALIGINGWVKYAKERGERSLLSEAVGDVQACVRSILGGGTTKSLSSHDRGNDFQRICSAAYLLVIFSASIRAVQLIREMICPQARAPQAITAGMVSPFASLARFVLGSVLGLILKDAVDSNMLKHSVSVKLNGIMLICSFVVSTVMLLADKGARNLTSDAGKLFLFAAFSAFNFFTAVMG